jgi:hypothetical protein
VLLAGEGFVQASSIVVITLRILASKKQQIWISSAKLPIADHDIHTFVDANDLVAQCGVCRSHSLGFC